MSDLIITILAGGEGKRMRSDIPKVLHIFKEKPMLAGIIETVRELNPKKNSSGYWKISYINYTDTIKIY